MLVLLAFLKIFIPKSEERSGTAGLRKLVSDTLAKASVLKDFSSSLHFIVRSYIPQKEHKYIIMCQKAAPRSIIRLLHATLSCQGSKAAILGYILFVCARAGTMFLASTSPLNLFNPASNFQKQVSPQYSEL